MCQWLHLHVVRAQLRGCDYIKRSMLLLLLQVLLLQHPLFDAELLTRLFLIRTTRLLRVDRVPSFLHFEVICLYYIKKVCIELYFERVST